MPAQQLSPECKGKGRIQRGVQRRARGARNCTARSNPHACTSSSSKSDSIRVSTHSYFATQATGTIIFSTTRRRGLTAWETRLATTPTPSTAPRGILLEPARRIRRTLRQLMAGLASMAGESGPSQPPRHYASYYKTLNNQGTYKNALNNNKDTLHIVFVII